MAPRARCHVMKSISYEKRTTTWNMSHHFQPHWYHQLFRHRTRLPNNQHQPLGRSLTQCNHISTYSNHGLRKHRFSKLWSVITHTFPTSKQLLDLAVRGYWEVCSWLTHSDEIICLDKRTVIPQKLQKQVLEHLQSAHQGITSMKARANQCVHWPEMSRSIKNYRYNCTTCGLLAPSHKVEPTRITPFPECLL